MWVNAKLFQMIVDDNKAQQEQVLFERTGASRLSATVNAATAQKAKDDITIDWMRHRINALEKQNSILVAKIAGVHFPVPEIVPTRPGSLSGAPIDFDHMPSFEDCGDQEAARLGITLADDGTLAYTK
jgi:hypothetical protein